MASTVVHRIGDRLNHDKPLQLLHRPPRHLPNELFTTLLAAADVRIERIVSRDHASTEGYMYDQDQLEWVVAIKGAARLRSEDDE